MKSKLTILFTLLLMSVFIAKAQWMNLTNANTVYIVESDGIIPKTTDGGANMIY